MEKCRLVLDRADGTRVWINMMHVVKMEKTVDGRYYLYLSNGETYEISRRDAGRVEDLLDD